MVGRLHKNSKGNQLPTIPWVWLVLCVLLILLVSLPSCSVFNPDPFVMIGGDEQLVVLLRGEKDGQYQVKYEGRDPTELNSLHVMLGGQILHVDIKQVTIIHNEQEVVLEGNGKLPEGAQLPLNPGDEFEVQVTYLGQTLGGNYMYGFRIGYGDDPQAEPWDLITEFDFAVVVE
jgi:hypothetical protein